MVLLVFFLLRDISSFQVSFQVSSCAGGLHLGLRRFHSFLNIGPVYVSKKTMDHLSGPFLSILIEFLTNRKQRVVVDGHEGEWRNVISGVPQGSVLGPLLFILYTQDMWVGLENELVAYADDATLIAVIPSSDQRLLVSESLNRDLTRINEWCRLWGMKLNSKKTQSMIISRSRTLNPNHPDLSIGNDLLVNCDSFKILGIMFDSKFTFEKHIRSISSLVAQKIGLLRKSYKIFGDHSVLKKCFNSFILPCLEYCSPVWSSAAPSYLKLLDRNVRACKFLVPDLEVDLWHRRSISSLCMLYKSFYNPDHLEQEPVGVSLAENRTNFGIHSVFT